MAKEKNMAEMADIFHVSASALRYWEQEGLIRFQRTPHNRYRQPSAQTMWDLCEVLFYRNLSVPIADMRRIPGMQVHQMQQMLHEHEQRLRARIVQLEETVRRIAEKQEAIAQIGRLEADGFVLVKEKLDAIDAFAFEKSIMQAYIHHPDRAAVMLEPEPSLRVRQGIFGHQGVQPCIKEADEQETLYLKGLLRIQSDDMQTASYTAATRRAYETFANAARAQGYQPGALYGRYLLSACEQTRYDYYEAWLALETKDDAAKATP